jgi:outer membrane protein OmpA-like peptidoglycan-associated protein
MGVIVASFAVSNAQDSPTDTLKFLRYGGYIQAGIDHHRANFGKFNDVAFCCPDNFSNKQLQVGVGAALGGLLEFPLSFDSKWFVDIRLGAQFNSGTLSQDHKTKFNDTNNIAQDGTFNYSISTKMGGISLLVMPSYHISNRLSLHVGVEAKYLFLGTFNQIESVVTQDAFFYNTSDSSLSKERNKTSGNIPGLQSLQLSGIAGLSYEIPTNVNGSTLLSPELFYRFGITQITSALSGSNSWQMNGLYAGISFRYSPSPTILPVLPEVHLCRECEVYDTLKKDCIPTIECAKNERREMDSITKECKCIPTIQIAQIDSIVGTFADGSTQKYPQLEVKVQQFRKITLKPLLPYLFYSPSANSLSDSYLQIDRSQTGDYSLEKAVKKYKNSKEPLAHYYDILNIIGKRLESIPDAILTITGCNDGVENNGKAVANDRALIVKRYFQETWMIPDERIVVVPRDMPANPATVNTSTTDERARQENRRVELSSNNSAVLAPIQVEDIDREVEPTKLSYFATIKSPSPISGGYFELKQEKEGNFNINTIETYRFAKDVPQHFDIQWEKIIPLSQGKLLYDLKVNTKEGRFEASKNSLNLRVKQITPEDKKNAGVPDKYSKIFDIIVYDINSTGMTPTNTAMIDEAIKIITPKSVVRVIGFTDNIGTNEYNKQLALKRAEQVAALLPKQAKVEVSGDGISKQYDNTTPEGRNYNRTVRIIVETDNRK